MPSAGTNPLIPTLDTMPVTDVDINLGSPFAAGLGFPSSVKPYVHIEEEFEVILNYNNIEPLSVSPSKKKKKKSNKKKKKK